jgi:hypothetical protein
MPTISRRKSVPATQPSNSFGIGFIDINKTKTKLFKLTRNTLLVIIVLFFFLLLFFLFLIIVRRVKLAPIHLLVSPAFIVHFPQGIGRSICSQFSQDYTNCQKGCVPGCTGTKPAICGIYRNEFNACK